MSTIKSSCEIDAMFRGAKKTAHPLLIMLIAQTPEGRSQMGRVAFVAGKKLGGAVLRNRCRRVMRETVRRCGGPWVRWDVVLIARAQTAAATTGELDEALGAVLARARLS